MLAFRQVIGYTPVVFVRVKRSVQPSGTYEYLQIVESARQGPRVRQHVLATLGRLAADRHFAFDVERTTVALALQRLCAPGSDLQGAQWLPTVECPGFDRIALQHLYRTVGGFLAAVREDLERDLFLKDRDLFSQELDLLFLDTTSTFIWRDTETPLRRRGYSRDRRPDQP